MLPLWLDGDQYEDVQFKDGVPYEGGTRISISEQTLDHNEMKKLVYKELDKHSVGMLMGLKKVRQLTVKERCEDAPTTDVIVLRTKATLRTLDNKRMGIKDALAEKTCDGSLEKMVLIQEYCIERDGKDPILCKVY